MKPGAPWSVKGIEPQTRETAKSAARRAGMTLGEWLNQVILETGVDNQPLADPMRAPDDWMRETGQDLPWTKSVNDLSTEVSQRLSASELENTSLLTSLEIAIGGISKRLVALDHAAQSPQNKDLGDRLARMEQDQQHTRARALSKDNLKSLETAVGQISVVLDSNNRKIEERASHQESRLDTSHDALSGLDLRLRETEGRVNQALSAVEAASNLYEITDKHGQMIDALVMDVAGVHADQKQSEAASQTDFAKLSGELADLKAAWKVLETKVAMAAHANQDETSQAANAISQQIQGNETALAACVAQIEEQITELSQVLERSLGASQSGIKDLNTAFASILLRIEALEGRPVQIQDQRDLADLADLPEDTSPEDVFEQAPPQTEKPAITFTTRPQQSGRTVHLNMAVNLESDLTLAPAQEMPVEDETSIEEPEDAALLQQDPRPDTAPLETAPIIEIELVDDLEDEVDDLEDRDDWQTELEAMVANKSDKLIDLDENIIEAAPQFDNDDTPLSFAQVLPPESDTEDLFDIDDAAPVFAAQSDKDAALREAVVNISSVRASFAAKNDARSRPGSIRQIVDAGEQDSGRRGWALAAGGVIVGLVAISGVLAYSTDTNLAQAIERPALFEQMTSWLPGRTQRSASSASDARNAAAPQLQSDLATPQNVQITGKTIPEPAASLEPQLTSIQTHLIEGLDSAARAGDPRAQFALGRALASGDGRAMDRAAALEWYQAAADQDLAIAQYVLGSLYERGVDTPQDKKTALDWYAAAARNGNRRSMHNLGVAYARGDIIGQDLALAVYWFSEAATLGLTDSQYNLALLFERGLGVDKNPSAAWQWYRVAAQGGDKAATTQAIRLEETLTSRQRETAVLFISTWQPGSMEPIANGLFDISPQAWDNGQKRGQLAIVQTSLLTLGYTLASSDGIMDPTTRNAIKDFQVSQNLKVTGTVTPGLLESLAEASSP